jgi:hypothetical protein
VETKVETLGLLEHISLGTVKVTDEFFRQVTFGTKVTPGARIFIRRIFPIQDENDEKMMQKVIVTEAVKGESLTHIDDCHVLVIQVQKKYVDEAAQECFFFNKLAMYRIGDTYPVRFGLSYRIRTFFGPNQELPNRIRLG